MKTTLHHFAYNISPNSLELVMKLFEKLGLVMCYRDGDARWCILEQAEIPVSMQVIETDDQIIEPIEKKMNTHVAFFSDSPAKDVDEIEKWCNEQGIKFRRGGWSEKELWFDLPDIFVNFVVEVMNLKK